MSPILNRLDLSHAIAHFAGGGLFSFHSKKKKEEIDHQRYGNGGDYFLLSV